MTAVVNKPSYSPATSSLWQCVRQSMKCDFRNVVMVLALGLLCGACNPLEAGDAGDDLKAQISALQDRVDQLEAIAEDQQQEVARHEDAIGDYMTRIEDLERVAESANK